MPGQQSVGGCGGGCGKPGGANSQVKDDGKRLRACEKRLRVALNSAKRISEGGCGGEDWPARFWALGRLTRFFGHLELFFACFFCSFFVLFFCSFLSRFKVSFWELFGCQNRVNMRLCDFSIFIVFP